MSCPKLIECGDHRLAPWATTCSHIMLGTATDVVPIRCEEGSEIEHDWLCPQCFRKYYLDNRNAFDVDDLRAVCIHGLREVMKPYREQMRRRLRRGTDM